MNISSDKQTKSSPRWLGHGLLERNFSRETVSLLIAAQNNAIRTNYVKAKIDKTRQNSKYRLCGNGDECINHLVSECRKLAQNQYKTRHDWAGKGNCARNLNLTILTYEQAGIHAGKKDTQSSLGFWGTNRSPNQGQMTRHSDCQKKENLSNSQLRRPSGPQSEIKRKQKER